MSVFAAAAILVMVLVTSAISGVFGMAGGMMLMGGLAFLLPVNMALALHGIIQITSNGSRVIIHHRHVAWRVVGFFAIGAVAAMGLFSLIAFTPSRLFVYLALGALPLLVWLPERWFNLDATSPGQAILCGLLSNGLSLTAGVSGPFTDLWFVRTDLTRHQVVATKSFTQAFGHLSKIIVYGAALLSPAGRALVPLWLFGAAVLVSIAGILVGGWVLDRMTDTGFRRWRIGIITAMGGLYLVQAGAILLHPAT
jgi:uncharacterized membrane protein YfcA